MKRVNIKCPYCRSPAYLRPASVVYGAHTADPNAKVYVCAHFPACNSYVSAHRTTLLPMGTLANESLRRKRMEAHAALQKVVKSGLMTKKQMYRCLQAEFGLPESEAHIGKFSELRCQKVISLCESFFHPIDRAA